MSLNFSVAIIAKNGAATLPRLFECLQPFMRDGGEVVLLDTGSADNTPVLAQQYGCVVHAGFFDGTIGLGDAHELNKLAGEGCDYGLVEPGDRYFNFARARNAAAGFCKNAYILVLDCDVVLKHFDYPRICEHLRQTACDVYYAGYDFGNGQVTSNIFLYNKLTQQYVGVVHEVVEPLNAEYKRKDGSLSKLMFEPVHKPDDKSRSHYLTGLAAQWLVMQDNPRATYYLGRELFYRKMYRAAFNILSRRMGQEGWAAERSDAAVLAGHCAWNMGMHPVNFYITAFEIYAGRRAPLIALADYYFKAKDWQKCASYASAALEIPWNAEFTNFEDHYGHVPYGLRYVARYNGNLNADGAYDDFWKAYKLAPHLYEGDKHLFEKKKPGLIS